MTTISDAIRPGFLIFTGAIIVLLSSIAGFVRAFTMNSDMGGMPMPGEATNPLHGMPPSEMPEMFIAVIGLGIVVVGVIVHGSEQKVRGLPGPVSARRKVVLAVVGTAALTIDISKTSTLGFVIPGMRTEYGIEASTASLLAVAGLSGAATGAVLFGVLVDRIGLRASYLIATLGFTATSMCGCMPNFPGNLVMCGLMGTAVGGLAPLLVSMLTEAFGGRTRGSIVVALSVVATAVGYLVAAGSALWLEPIFSWRVLWLIGAPTGFLLVLAAPIIPQWTSPRKAGPVQPVRPSKQAKAFPARLQRGYAFLVGVLTFGLTTWVPSLARLGGLSTGTANLLLTVAAVVMVPCALLIMLGYRRLGPVILAAGQAGIVAVLLLALTLSGAATSVGWICAGALVAALFSVNTMAAVFLPTAADLSEPVVRGRTTGTVSLYNRIGGLCGPLLLANLASSVSGVLIAVSALALVCAAAAWYLGKRQRIVTATHDSAVNAKI